MRTMDTTGAATGHLDTVWPVGTLKRMPWRVEDGWAYGTRVLDMKAGVVMALAAMKLVREVDARPASGAGAERR